MLVVGAADGAWLRRRLGDWRLGDFSSPGNAIERFWSYTLSVTLRFDENTRSLRLSVADLLERDVRTSLGFASRGGFERLWMGQAIHSRYQSAAIADDPSYRQEVGLSLELEHRGWKVILQGRIDGLTRGPDNEALIEEIKSVRRLGQLSRGALEMYRQQASIYAWMWGKLEGEVALARLVLIEIGTHRVETVMLEIDSKAVEDSILHRLDQILRKHEESQEKRSERRRAAERLTFPYDTLRKGQGEIVEATERALEQREHLFVEAPTGLGKTVAVLLPVLRYAMREDKRVYVLTAKNLQQEMAGEVLRLLNPDGSFHTLRLRAKARMCANTEIICHEEYCRFARDYFLKVRTTGIVQNLLAASTDLQPDQIFEEARAAEVCPFEISLELCAEAQAVVCDYNYVFDPYVALRRFAAGNDLSDTILVVDEAHNLVDRGRGYYSPELSEEQLGPVQKLLVGTSSDLDRDIQSLSVELSELIRSTVDDALPFGKEDGTVEVLLPEDPLWGLRPAFDAAFVDYLEAQRQAKTYQADDPFIALYFGFVRFLEALALASPSFSFLAIRQEGRRSLKILCRDASPFLGQIINRSHSTIALSATLSPTEFYQELLGFDAQRTSAVSLPSPFPAENRRIVIEADITTTWKQRQESYPLIAERLAAFVEEIPGNCMALFPSYVFVSEVASRLPKLGREVIVQQRSNSAEERQAILDRLRSSLSGKTLLLAVAGGVFAEGVDYPGKMLEAVVIVGPCLPSLSFEQQLLQAFYEERFERGFEYAFVIPGMTRVIQAAGRLIRSDKDRGVIALLDRRFLSKQYSRHLPAAWLPEEGVQGLVGRADEVAREFWSSGR